MLRATRDGKVRRFNALDDAALSARLWFLGAFLDALQFEGTKLPTLDRRRAAKLAPFLSELAQDRSLPFREALRSLGEDSAETPMVPCTRALAKDFGLPFPTVWPFVIMDLLEGETELLCLSGLAWQKPETVWKGGVFDVQFGPRCPAPWEHDRPTVASGQALSWWACQLHLSPVYRSGGALHRDVERQIRSAFDRAWTEGKRNGSALVVRMLHYLPRTEEIIDEETGGLVLPDPLPPQPWTWFEELPLNAPPFGYSAPQREDRRACVSTLCTMLAPRVVIGPAGPGGGPQPDWRDAARWWALHALGRLSPEKISAQEDPECSGLVSPERVRQCLYRLRRLDP